MENFKHSIQMPVPIGEKVWTFWTDCCMACYFQPRDKKPIKCDTFAPCHTLLHTVQPVKMKYSNMETILSQWGKKYFYTEQEARDAAEKLIADHMAKMKELGYKPNEEGYAKKEEGWEDKL